MEQKQQLSIFDFSDSDKSENDGEAFPDDYVPNSVQSQDSTDDLNVHPDVYSPASSNRSKCNNDIDQLINRLESEGNTGSEQNEQIQEDNTHIEQNESKVKTLKLNKIERRQEQNTQSEQTEQSQEQYSQSLDSNEPEIVFHMPSQAIGGTVYGSYDINPDLVESYDVENWDSYINDTNEVQPDANSALDYVDDLLRNQGQSETTSHQSSSISSSPIIQNLLDEIDDLSQDDLSQDDLSQDERSRQSTNCTSSSKMFYSKCTTYNC